MSTELVEIIYGCDRVHHVLAPRGWFSMSYDVKSTDGAVRAAFDRLDADVRYARGRAATH